VVRGLVENEYVEFFAEDLGERDALELAAGETAGFYVDFPSIPSRSSAASISSQRQVFHERCHW